jgi:hypothetical protein
MTEKETQVQKLKKLAKLTGIDVEAALHEVQEQTVKMALDQILPLLKQVETKIQTPNVNVDMDQLTAKVVEALKPEIRGHIDKSVAESELRIATKIAEVIDEIQKKIEGIKVAGGQPLDQQAIISGVAATLQPIIIQESQKAVEAIFKANFQALQAEIYRQIDEKMKSMQPAVGTEVAADQSQGGGGMIGNLVQAFSAFASTPIGEKLLDRFLGGPVANLADPVKKLEDYYRLDKIFRGLSVDGDEKRKVIETLIGKTIENPQT